MVEAAGYVSKAGFFDFYFLKAYITLLLSTYLQANLSFVILLC